MTISIGTASSMPHTFQTQPQKSSPMKIATAFMRAARLVSHGVSRNPSRLVITSATPDTNSAIRTLPNCMNATAAVLPETMTGPKYGIELKTPARMPQTAACSSPIARNASHETSATLVKSCTIRNADI